MADQAESDLRDDTKDKNFWYPLRKWWRPYWLFTQDFGQTPIQDPVDLWRGMDLLQKGWSSGRPWPECTSSPLIVPLQPGPGYDGPPGPGGGQGEQYKWRVVLDVGHFAPSDIWIGTVDGVLEIRGKHKERQDEHGFIARCFTRKYRLPIGIDLSRITSILSGDGIMYVEAPLTEFTAPADIVIPIQVEREVTEVRQGEEEPEDNVAAPPEAAPTAPGDPASVAPETPREVTDHGEASPAGEEDQAGGSLAEPPQHDVERTQEGPGGEEEEEGEEKAEEEEGEEKAKEEVTETTKEQEPRDEVAEESPSAAGPGEGPENLPEPVAHHQVPEESPTSLESSGSPLSDQKEETGNALPEPQPAESSGKAAVEATQMEEPTESESPSNQDVPGQEPLAVDTEPEPLE